MSVAPSDTALQPGRRLVTEILSPMKQAFVGKDEIIDLLGLCLVAGENLFLLGPPGTAKSALVQDLARRIDGRSFDYLLTRFTEPNEIFGPFDIRKLREGELLTNTEGMLPEADFVFLDELLNANSAILNSLLLVLNERMFRRGRETRSLPTLMVVGASNHLPEDDALSALFDRFLIRVHCDNVDTAQLSSVLTAGWKLDVEREFGVSSVTVEDIRQLQQQLRRVNFDSTREAYVELVTQMRKAGMAISDRRAVKLQRMLAASALLCGRYEINQTDLWVLRYIWDTEEQQEILAGLVQEALAKASEADVSASHPRSQQGEQPNAELLARDLEQIADALRGEAGETQRSSLRDQLSIITSRVQWISDSQQQQFLQQQLEPLWQQLGAAP
jgi:MoxR-like ATPase